MTDTRRFSIGSSEFFHKIELAPTKELFCPDYYSEPAAFACLDSFTSETLIDRAIQQKILSPRTASNPFQNLSARLDRLLRRACTDTVCDAPEEISVFNEAQALIDLETAGEFMATAGDPDAWLNADSRLGHAFFRLLQLRSKGVSFSEGTNDDLAQILLDFDLSAFTPEVLARWMSFKAEPNLVENQDSLFLPNLITLLLNAPAGIYSIEAVDELVIQWCRSFPKTVSTSILTDLYGRLDSRSAALRDYLLGEEAAPVLWRHFRSKEPEIAGNKALQFYLLLISAKNGSRPALREAALVLSDSNHPIFFHVPKDGGETSFYYLFAATFMEWIKELADATDADPVLQGFDVELRLALPLIFRREDPHAASLLISLSLADTSLAFWPNLEKNYTSKPLVRVAYFPLLKSKRPKRLPPADFKSIAQALQKDEPAFQNYRKAGVSALYEFAANLLETQALVRLEELTDTTAYKVEATVALQQIAVSIMKPLTLQSGDTRIAGPLQERAMQFFHATLNVASYLQHESALKLATSVGSVLQDEDWPRGYDRGFAFIRDLSEDWGDGPELAVEILGGLMESDIYGYQPAEQLAKLVADDYPCQFMAWDKLKELAAEAFKSGSEIKMDYARSMKRIAESEASGTILLEAARFLISRLQESPDDRELRPLVQNLGLGAIEGRLVDMYAAGEPEDNPFRSLFNAFKDSVRGWLDENLVIEENALEESPILETGADYVFAGVPMDFDSNNEVYALLRDLAFEGHTGASNLLIRRFVEQRDLSVAPTLKELLESKRSAFSHSVIIQNAQAVVLKDDERSSAAFGLLLIASELGLVGSWSALQGIAVSENGSRDIAIERLLSSSAPFNPERNAALLNLDQALVSRFRFQPFETGNWMRYAERLERLGHSRLKEEMARPHAQAEKNEPLPRENLPFRPKAILSPTLTPSLPIVVFTEDFLKLQEGSKALGLRRIIADPNSSHAKWTAALRGLLEFSIHPQIGRYYAPQLTLLLREDCEEMFVSGQPASRFRAFTIVRQVLDYGWLGSEPFLDEARQLDLRWSDLLHLSDSGE